MDFQNGRILKEKYHFYRFWGAFAPLTAFYGLIVPMQFLVNGYEMTSKRSIA